MEIWPKLKSSKMYTPTILSDASVLAINQLPVVQNLCTDVSTINNNLSATRISEILKENSRRFALASKVRVPLGHISLATELIESLPANNDLEMCLKVITRSTTRINSLVNEFLSFKQIEEVKA